MNDLLPILQKYWGFDSLRPLQAEAMQCVMVGRDSVVVLPTGGGKSLCFQAPALLQDGLAVVVSPLIALMKDQVDALTDNGVPAACVNSTLSVDERRQVADDVRSGKLKLLYLSPERLMTERTLEFLREANLSYIAIDEAHCISEWGHDFRPEYRMLGVLKQQFPGIALHAYTATATESVRHDIIRELHLENAELLVGFFDRPNLVYRVERRSDLLRQVCEVIDRHPDQSGIIYSIKRDDVDSLAAALATRGYSAIPYHAGMNDQHRKANQEAFLKDRAKIIVATVAFGMGIDKSDVRYVIHAAAPKSLESYQQESGRAGRDGLEAECCLFCTGGDFQVWRRLQKDLPEKAYEIAMTVLGGIEDYTQGVTCRHRALVNYFGQSYPDKPCGACDVCLAELDLVDEPLVLAQKILSCVVRVEERFGGDYTAQVLTGSKDQRILENRHDRLSTHGLLSEHPKKHVRDWIEQLVGQGCLKKQGEYSTLSVTPIGWEVLRGDRTPQLLKPAAGRERKRTAAELDSWEGVDEGLFEQLRTLRREKADARGLPPFTVFSDATLRDLARRRPSSPEALLDIHGIGEAKRKQYGDDFLKCITEYCATHNVTTDVDIAASAPARNDSQRGSRGGSRSENASVSRPSAEKQRAWKLFAQGKSLEEVRTAVGRAPTTTVKYLVEYIEQEGITDPSPWVDAATFGQIRTAAERVGMDLLSPIHKALEETIDYDRIRIAVTCLQQESQQ